LPGGKISNLLRILINSGVTMEEIQTSPSVHFMHRVDGSSSISPANFLEKIVCCRSAASTEAQCLCVFSLRLSCRFY
jgi:hypothetical protein